MVFSIKKQGVYSAGGSVQQAEGTFDPIAQWQPEGQSRHSDHANVFYQIPEGDRGNIMYLHGAGQSRNGWISTPDGRDSLANIFLARGYSSYLVDQPRRASAGQSSVATEISAVPDDQSWYTQFRMGLWPQLQDGIQFDRSEETLNQFFRQYTPDTGEFDAQVVSSALIAAAERSGPVTLVTHSQGGIPGWFAAAESEQIEAVIALEPGAFVFPEDDMPDGEDSASPYPVEGVPVPRETFERLISKPIAVYYGDFIPSEPSSVPAWDFWRAGVAMAHKFADYANAHGGDVTVYELPREGITGNSHFMFQELNNREIADHIETWLTARTSGR